MPRTTDKNREIILDNMGSKQRFYFPYYITISPNIPTGLYSVKSGCYYNDYHYQSDLYANDVDKKIFYSPVPTIQGELGLQYMKVNLKFELSRKEPISKFTYNFNSVYDFNAFIEKVESLGLIVKKTNSSKGISLTIFTFVSSREKFTNSIIFDRFELSKSSIRYDHPIIKYGHDSCVILSVMKNIANTPVDNELIESLMTSEEVYYSAKGNIRKTLYVSPNISEYTIDLIQVLGYRINVTIGVNSNTLVSVINSDIGSFLN